MSLFPSPFPTTTFQPFYPKLAMEPPPLQVTSIRPKPIGVPKWHRSCPTLQPSATPPSSSHQALTPSRAWHRDNPPPRDYLPSGTIPHGCYPSTCCGVPPDKTTRGTLMTPKAILREGQQGLLLANLLQHCTNTQQKTKKPTPNLKCRPHSSHPMPSAAATNPEAPGW